MLASTDKIQYALEIRIDGYYPVFQEVSGSVSLEAEMQTAAGVVVSGNRACGRGKQALRGTAGH